MKTKLSKIGNRLERRQPDAGGQGFDRSALSLQSEPGIVVGGECKGGDIKVGIGKEDPRPDDSRSISRSLVGMGHDQEGSDDKASEGDVDGKRTDQVDPPPPSDIRNKSPISSASRVGESKST